MDKFQNMTQVEDLPVLILGYMRFDGVLECLEACFNAGIRKVYVSLDGPKDPISEERQQEGINRIYEFADLRKLKLILRKRHSNAGLAVGVIEGISWFFEQENQGVILEDDLVLSTDFFKFAIEALEKYSDNKTIALISGNNFFSESSTNRISALNYPLIWGWATTKQTWCAFIDSLHVPLNPIFNRNLSAAVNAFWWTAAKQSRAGLVDSWAMSFSNFIRMRNLMCLLPPVNLVSNNGADQHAIHSNISDPFINFPLGKLESDIDWNLPTQDVVSAQNLYTEKFVYKISNRNLLSPFKFILRHIFFEKLNNRGTLVARLVDSYRMEDFSVFRRGV